MGNENSGKDVTNVKKAEAYFEENMVRNVTRSNILDAIIVRDRVVNGREFLPFLTNEGA